MKLKGIGGGTHKQWISSELDIRRAVPRLARADLKTERLREDLEHDEKIFLAVERDDAAAQPEYLGRKLDVDADVPRAVREYPVDGRDRKPRPRVGMGDDRRNPRHGARGGRADTF